MLKNCIILLVLLILHIKSYSFNTFESNVPILNTLNGKVKGKCVNVSLNKNTYNNSLILIWHSVPYAEVPINKLRFKNPQPIKSWNKTIDGTKPGKACMQPFLNPKEMSENCLHLTIYAPYNNYIKSVIQNDTSYLVPILVWIHGGSFRYGSSNDYDGSILTASSNLIVITINYRLGLFGFLHINETDANGNQALLDQKLALKWIYENSQQFGGDKTRITLSGESASYHLIFQSSWPYFNNAILQSGNPIKLKYDSLLSTSSQATKLSIQLGYKIGCKNKIVKNLFDCLQSMNESILANKSEIIKLPMFVLNTQIFNHTNPKDLFELGQFKKCNIIVGFNDYEEINLASYEIGNELINRMIYGSLNSLKSAIMIRLETNETIANKIIKLYIPLNKMYDRTINYYNYFIKMITDYQFKCPTYQLADYYSNSNLESYVYMYAHKSSISKKPYVCGALHSEEIPFMFGYPLSSNNSFTFEEKIFSQKLVNYWTNFALNNKPTSNNEWPKFNDNKSLRNIFYLKENSFKFFKMIESDQKCQFWNNFSLNYTCSSANNCFK